MIENDGCGGCDEAIRPLGDEVTLVTAGRVPLRTAKHAQIGRRVTAARDERGLRR